MRHQGKVAIVTGANEVIDEIVRNGGQGVVAHWAGRTHIVVFRLLPGNVVERGMRRN